MSETRETFSAYEIKAVQAEIMLFTSTMSERRAIRSSLNHAMPMVERESNRHLPTIQEIMTNQS